MKKKPNIIKDALVLFVITIAAGLLLGGMHYITKEPIAAAEQEAKNKAYQEVLAQANSFEECFEKELEESDQLIAEHGELAGVSIDGALKGIDENGDLCGYVVLASSSKSYGGVISLVVGMDVKGIVTGVSVLAISDTPGLGMKAKDESFRNQFVGVDTALYDVVKNGKEIVGDIDAISSATITSRAFTAAVNGAKIFLDNSKWKGGNADE